MGRREIRLEKENRQKWDCAAVSVTKLQKKFITTLAAQMHQDQVIKFVCLFVCVCVCSFLFSFLLLRR
jgi:hypothetical protein